MMMLAVTRSCWTTRNSRTIPQISRLSSNRSSGYGRPTRREHNRDPLFRLRRPQDPQQVTHQPSNVTGIPGKRRGTMILFPGDYSDRFRSADTSTTQNTTGPDADQVQRQQQLLAEYQRTQAQRQKWHQNAKPKQWKIQIDERGRAYGRGARKSAHARVWIQAGLGQVTINRRSFTDYFDRTSDRDFILQPLVATETCGQFDVTATVQGGGLTGQAGAIRLGVARALNAYDPEFRPPLKYLGFLTRDARRVERKKVGKVKARKSPQWVRR